MSDWRRWSGHRGSLRAGLPRAAYLLALRMQLFPCCDGRRMHTRISRPRFQPGRTAAARTLLASCGGFPLARHLGLLQVASTHGLRTCLQILLGAAPDDMRTWGGRGRSVSEEQDGAAHGGRVWRRVHATSSSASEAGPTVWMEKEVDALLESVRMIQALLRYVPHPEKLPRVPSRGVDPAKLLLFLTGRRWSAKK